MAGESIILTNAQVLLSTGTIAQAKNVSNLVKSVELNRSFNLLDDTVMGETAESRKTGLESVTATVNFVWTVSCSTAHAQANLDSLMWRLSEIGKEGNSFKVFISPKNAEITPTNPRYSFSAVMESYMPVTGSVGQLLETSIPFQSAGGSLTRASSS